MNIKIPKIPNDLSSARKQYEKVLNFERKLENLLLKLDQCLKEGKQGNLSNEYLDDLRKRSKKSKMSLVAEKMALEEKIKKLEQVTKQSDELTTNCELKKNPLRLIIKKPVIQKTQRRPATFPKITIFKVKLVHLRSITLQKKLQIINAPLKETQLLKPFQSTVNSMDSRDDIEDIQTMRGGNDESYFLHVLSMTGSPHVLLSLSFSNTLELSPPPTTQTISTLQTSSLTSIVPILRRRLIIQIRDQDLIRMLFSVIELLRPRLISTRRDSEKSTSQGSSLERQIISLMSTLAEPVFGKKMRSVPSLSPTDQQQSVVVFDRHTRAQLLSPAGETLRMAPLNIQVITEIIQASSLPTSLQSSSVVFDRPTIVQLLSPTGETSRMILLNIQMITEMIQASSSPSLRPSSVVFDRPLRAQLSSPAGETPRITSLNMQMITGIIQASSSPSLQPLSVVFDQPLCAQLSSPAGETPRITSLNMQMITGIIQGSSSPSLQPLSVVFDQPLCAQLLSPARKTSRIEPLNMQTITETIQALSSRSLQPSVFGHKIQTEIYLQSPQHSSPSTGKTSAAVFADRLPCIEMSSTRGHVRMATLMNALLQPSVEQSRLSPVFELNQPFQLDEISPHQPSLLPRNITNKGEILQIRGQVRITPLMNALIQPSPQQSRLPVFEAYQPFQQDEIFPHQPSTPMQLSEQDEIFQQQEAGQKSPRGNLQDVCNVGTQFSENGEDLETSKNENDAPGKTIYNKTMKKKKRGICRQILSLFTCCISKDENNLMTSCCTQNV